MYRAMVAVRRKVMSILDFLSFFRDARKEGFDRFVVTPIAKSDKAEVKYWKYKAALKAWKGKS